MKKINRKKLNNKGFTLIELLAVVVILAVVMGIAMTSVLTAMNKSRAGSLEDSAKVMADGFNKKYTESLVDGVPNDIYKTENVAGYDFTHNTTLGIATALKDVYNISADAYDLADTSVYVAGKSFVDFNATTGKFVVCLFAKSSGNIFVAANANGGTISNLAGTTSGVTTEGTMYACSDGQKSWT